MRPTQIDQPAKRSKKPFIFGCLGGGCLALVLTILGFSMYWLNWAKSIPEDAPSVTPKPFVQEDFDNLSNRYESFRKGVQRGNTDELVLTEDDINVCLSKWAKEADDAAQMTVRLDGTTAMGQASIPITTDKGEKKWINCEFIVGIAVLDGQLDLQLKEIKVKGKTFGETGILSKPIEELKRESLDKFHEDPNVKRQMDKIESVSIKDGKVYLKVKKGTTLDALPPSK
jgi:hypothetical protein